MPKAPPTEDRFTLHIYDIAPERLGVLQAMLTKAGFDKMQPELITTVMSYKRNTTVDADGKNGTDVAREWIAHHPTFKAVELARHFAEIGRAKGSVYKALTDLVAEKLLKQLGGGNYARTDVKHLAAPKVAKHTGEGNTARYAVSHGDTVLKFAGKRVGGFTSLEVKKHFEKIGRPTNGMSTTLGALVEKKKIRRIGEGTYELVASKANGNAAEAAHG